MNNVYLFYFSELTPSSQVTDYQFITNKTKESIDFLWNIAKKSNKMVFLSEIKILKIPSNVKNINLTFSVNNFGIEIDFHYYYELIIHLDENRIERLNNLVKDNIITEEVANNQLEILKKIKDLSLGELKKIKNEYIANALLKIKKYLEIDYYKSKLTPKVELIYTNKKYKYYSNKKYEIKCVVIYENFNNSNEKITKVYVPVGIIEDELENFYFIENVCV